MFFCDSGRFPKAAGGQRGFMQWNQKKQLWPLEKKWSYYSISWLASLKWLCKKCMLYLYFVFFKTLCNLFNLESLVICSLICLQSMHWAVRNKKEPMLEASKAEIPVTSQAEDLNSEEEAPRIPSYDAITSSSKWISKYSWCNGKYREPISCTIKMCLNEMLCFTLQENHLNALKFEICHLFCSIHKHILYVTYYYFVLKDNLLL